MLKDLTEGMIIKTKNGDGKIRKIGPVQRSENSRYSWAMLTLDINGQTVYCAAREDELKDS